MQRPGADWAELIHTSLAKVARWYNLFLRGFTQQHDAHVCGCAALARRLRVLDVALAAMGAGVARLVAEQAAALAELRSRLDSLKRLIKLKISSSFFVLVAWDENRDKGAGKLTVQ
jgi:O-acetyl-ADP-ribose deacetylase (regulator of RNase III)